MPILILLSNFWYVHTSMGFVTVTLEESKITESKNLFELICASFAQLSEITDWYPIQKNVIKI